MRGFVSLWVAAALLGVVGIGFLQAQAPAGVPTFSGKGKVTDAVNTDTGAIFDIGSGVTMTFPKGLPVGRSRLVTLALAKAIPAKLIPGFKAVGPAVSFSGAFSTSERPIVLALVSKRVSIQRGTKLVLAVEIGTFCDDKNKAFPLGGGLCSGFELVDSDYDATSKRLSANLRSTGGLRMQFGSVPESAE